MLANTDIRGDFNGDGSITTEDYKLFVPHLHTANALYNLVGQDTYINLFDYNLMLSLLTEGTPPAFPQLSTRTSCSKTPINTQPSGGYEYINVVSFNIGGRRMGLTNPTYLNGLANMIIDNNIDIAAFQEVADSPDGTIRVNDEIVKVLKQKNKTYYTSTQDGGVSFISRFPLTSHKLIWMGSGDGPGGNFGSRAAITNIATTPNSSVRVFDHHQNFPSGCIQLYPYFYDLINTYNDKNMVAFGDLNSTMGSYVDPYAGDPCSGGTAYGKRYGALSKSYLDFSCEPGKPCSATNQKPDWTFIPKMPGNSNNQAKIVESCLKGEYTVFTNDGHYPRMATIKIAK